MPSEIEGRTSAPPSKSLMIRAVAAGHLSGGTVQINHPSFCEDALASLEIIESLGNQVESGKERIEIKGISRFRKGVLQCRESGLCIRLFSPVAALLSGWTRLIAEGSLKARPLGPMEKTLHELGARIQTENGHPPVDICGPIRGGSVSMDGSLSSEFLTGLLFALPLCQENSFLSVYRLKSRPYLELTLGLLGHFGIHIDCDPGLTRFHIAGGQTYQPRDYSVEGDWSGASFLLVAAASAGKAQVDRLFPLSLQPDKNILEALDLAGVRWSQSGDRVEVEGGTIKPFDFDAADCPDLFPPLSVLASFSTGQCRIFGTQRLRHKESDRAAALCSELGKIGVSISVEDDALVIRGGSIKGGIVDAHGDHRIAMAAAVAGLRSRNGVAISGAHCVSKSYPDFFRDIEMMGGKVQ